MNKKSFPERHRTLIVLSFFAIALLIVGIVLRSRIAALIDTYTESQTEKQARAYSLVMEERLDTEIENLEYIASKLEGSLDDMEALMPLIHADPGIIQGVLGIDGKTLYGEDLDLTEFDDIQESFRGNKTVTYREGKGILFTCPVFHGPNIRYVLYRLCPSSVLEDYFSTEIYDDLGKICVTIRDGDVVIPFYESSKEDLAWYKSEDIRRKYRSMRREMEVSVAVAHIFQTDRGEQVLFESEIPGTDFLVSGFVPKSVASEGIGNITILVIWVFGLLMLLVMIGAVYLSRMMMKARESDELRKAKALAEEASRAKGDFLANMSHEIRTPINAVLGMNEMILRESDEEAVIEYSENIKAAGNTLLGLINDILDFSKIESGKIDIIPVEYDLSSVLGDLVNMIYTRADDKGLLFKTDFDRDIPRMLYGDEIRIKQVITNLLTNAVKYTEKGSVTFSAAYEKSEEEPDMVFLTVKVEDTGAGIREEDMDRLFAEFERIEESRNRYVEGTGLGMSITRSLLDMMGSSLDVKSTYGEGSVFSFRLKQKVINWEPLGDYATSCRDHLLKREKYRESFTAPDARILVVDDNQMNLTVFKGLIRQTQIRVDLAESGDSGLDLTGSEKYDMIFLDHMMPGKDGIETLKEIREQADGPNFKTPVVCLTANAISGSREMYLSAGFDDYLTKPIDANKLEKMLIAYLPEEKVRKTVLTKDGDKKEESASLPGELAKLAGQDIIDINTGLKNSGSVRDYISLLKIFYSSLSQKAAELDGLFAEDDLKNYTIKVHALKSSLRIIGASELGERAQQLEDAGKSEDAAYIKENHEAFISDYKSLKEPLSGLFEDEGSPDKPEADPELMKTLYGEMNAAADEMDCEKLQEILGRADGFRIPESEKDLWDSLKDAIGRYDYDSILGLTEDKR